MSEQNLHTVTEPTNPTPKKKRGRVRYAAPLGFLVLAFACIGVISVISGGIRLIAKWSDDTPLREELYTFLDPVMQFCPSNFEEGAAGEQDTLLLSAVYRVTEAERIRQLREKDNSCIYTLDGTGWRMKIPQTVIADSFTYLFGEVTLTHKTVGEVEYNEDEQQYYVPLSITTSGYTPVLGAIRRSKDTYRVQVTYVANGDVQVDEKGHTIPPTFNMGKYTQQYTVARNDDGSLTLQSVEAVD